MHTSGSFEAFVNYLSASDDMPTSSTSLELMCTGKMVHRQSYFEGDVSCAYQYPLLFLGRHSLHSSFLSEHLLLRSLWSLSKLPLNHHSHGHLGVVYRQGK